MIPLQFTYLKDSVFDLIQRMWCMLFHKDKWEPYGDGEKCSICGQEYDSPSQYDTPGGYKN